MAVENRPIEIALQWQEAANQQDIPRLLELSSEQVELLGPRGRAQGQAILAEWVKRANVRFTLLQAFAREQRVVLAQHGSWYSPESSELVGEADVASYFLIEDQQVRYLARYDTVDAALEAAELNLADEHPLDSSR